MQAISGIHNKKNDLLRRFLGEEVKIDAFQQIEVNRYVNAQFFEAGFPGDTFPEDKGVLHLFPVDDNKFCLQLLYIQSPEEQSNTAIVCSLRFLPPFFDQYTPEILMANRPFRFDETTEQQFSVCSRTAALLNNLQEEAATLTPFTRSLQQTEIAMQLLRRALECITVPFSSCQVPACRFLAFDSERDKIHDARSIIEQHLDQPFTIRELSRKVAMNECYLKKGFKALVGKTIHEYQQELRIAKAKELLQQQDTSVSDVANTLGYSSISHFSTAFKKATGIKPCELLK